MKKHIWLPFQGELRHALASAGDAVGYDGFRLSGKTITPLRYSETAA